jgi:MFS family permease
MVAGVGNSFVYWPSVTVVPQWFDKHRGSATGFAVLGAGIGNLASGALIGMLLTEEPDENSTRDALRGLALYCTVTLLFAMACMTRRLPAVPKKGMLSDSKEMLRNRTFLIMSAGAFFFGSAYTIPFSTIAAFAEDAGNDVQFSAILIGAIGIGSSVGRIALGFSADALGRLKTFKLSMAFTAIACSLWWFSRTSQEALLVFGAMFGFFSGGFISLVPVVVSEYFSPAKLGSIMGSISLFMVPGGFLGPFLAGVFYDQSGSYKAACIYTGVVISCSAIIFALLSPPSKVASHNTTT